MLPDIPPPPKPKPEPIGPQKPLISSRIILEFVSDAEHIEIEVLKSRIRQQRIVYVRHIAFYLIRNLAGLSYPQTGNAVGDKDHSTVMSALEKMAIRRATDRDYDTTIKHYEMKLRGRYQCKAPTLIIRRKSP